MAVESKGGRGAKSDVEERGPSQVGDRDEQTAFRDDEGAIERCVRMGSFRRIPFPRHRRHIESPSHSSLNAAAAQPCGAVGIAFSLPFQLRSHADAQPWANSTTDEHSWYVVSSAV